MAFRAHKFLGSFEKPTPGTFLCRRAYIWLIYSAARDPGRSEETNKYNVNATPLADPPIAHFERNSNGFLTNIGILLRRK